MNKLVVLFMLLFANSAFATWGWRGVDACYLTHREAAMSRCAVITVQRTDNNGATWYCEGFVAESVSGSECANPATDGNRMCQYAFTMFRFSEQAQPLTTGNISQSHRFFSCDYESQPLRTAASSTTVTNTVNVGTTTVTVEGGTGGSSTSGSITVTFGQDGAYDNWADMLIDAPNLAKAMAFGLGFIMLMWSFGFIAAVGKGMIKRV